MQPEIKKNIDIVELEHRRLVYRSDADECTQHSIIHSTYRYIIITIPPFLSLPGAMFNPQWLDLPVSNTNFHGPKDVRAIDIHLYLNKKRVRTK